MYVESLSSYARQFLGRMEKPDVEYIRGVSPAIAIEQKVNISNRRSTVGTSTEIYDYLKLLFARAGITYSPVSGQPVTRDTVDSVADFIVSQPNGTRLMILAPLQKTEDRTIEQEVLLLLQKGFTRIVAQGLPYFIEELAEKEIKLSDEDVFVLIDRLVVNTEDEDARFRIADSVQTAFYEGHDNCVIKIPDTDQTHHFSDRFTLDGIEFEEPTVNLFSFNNPYGVCRTCDGYGTTLNVDTKLIFPDEDKSVYEGGIAPWSTPAMRREWLDPLLKNGIRFDFPVHRAISELTKEEKDLLWKGNKYFSGLDDFFKMLKQESHRIQYRVMLSRFQGRVTCPDCRGTKLRKDAQYVKVAGKSITDLVLMQIKDLAPFFDTIELTPQQQKVADRLLVEVKNRLSYLQQVGLDYLTLNRLTATLSGGEYQRIKLATSLGSALVGSMYVLDEPSIGLHPHNTKQLIAVLKYLRDLGNTVIVVEHEEDIMMAADNLIDIGPLAGRLGGELMFQATPEQIITEKITLPDTPTARFLQGAEEIEIPKQRRKALHHITVEQARQNNLKNITVNIPLEVFVAVTGVSGSGKSTLIRQIVYPYLAQQLGQVLDSQEADFKAISGSTERINKIEMVDQNPIGRSSRSNPVTFMKAFDYIERAVRQAAGGQKQGVPVGLFLF